jgi:oligoendopeptidase F
MTSRSSSALRKPTAPRKPGTKTSAAKTKVGRLPEWNLADLYPGIDAPEVARDLQKI